MIADRCEDVVSQLVVGPSTGNGLAQSVVTGLQSESRSDRLPFPDGHAIHLCHCAHTHGSTLTSRDIIVDRVQAVAVVVTSQSDRIPPSVRSEPQLRPPRTLIA